MSNAKNETFDMEIPCQILQGVRASALLEVDIIYDLLSLNWALSYRAWAPSLYPLFLCSVLWRLFCFSVSVRLSPWVIPPHFLNMVK